MRRFILPFLAVLVPGISQARIGETLEECTARYGPMRQIENATGKFYSDYPQHCFEIAGLSVRIRFYNGRSAQEEFTAFGSIPSKQIEEIRAGNSEKQTGVKVVEERQSPNGGARDRLTITTKEFDQLMRKELGSGGF
jgi:hypothetical protein